MIFPGSRSTDARLAVVVGTALQKRIAAAIIQPIQQGAFLSEVTILSLDAFYQFDVDTSDIADTVRLGSFLKQPWYDRSRIVKLLSLPSYLWQIYVLSRRFRYFLFFVDTGVLERSAIRLLKRIGGYSLVLQDALKLPLKSCRKGLTWFGSGGADLYLISGRGIIPMICSGRHAVVGAPLFGDTVKHQPLGDNILFINQCPARYGYGTEDDEFAFAKEVVGKAAEIGSVELRLHPHNHVKRYLALNDRHVTVTYDRPMAKSLRDAGIVLTINSSTMLEAMAQGRPVLALDWFPNPFENNIRDGVIRCASLHDMRSALLQWKSGQPLAIAGGRDVQREIERFIEYSGHQSVARFVEIISGFIAETDRVTGQ